MIKFAHDFNIDSQMLEFIVTDGKRQVCVKDIKWDEKPSVVLSRVEKAVDAFNDDLATRVAGTP